MRVNTTIKTKQEESKENIKEFLEFLECQNNHIIIVKVELNAKERLALEFYAHQMQVESRDLIESAVKSNFDRFFQSF